MKKLTPEERLAKEIVDYVHRQTGVAIPHPVGAGIAKMLLTFRCDCGASVTSCYDCTISDYQAAHPECRACCPDPPAAPHQDEPPQDNAELAAVRRE